MEDDVKDFVHSDGRSVRFLKKGTDDRGEFLLIEHHIPSPRIMSGPHWHPHLEETFTIQQGSMRFIINKEEKRLYAGESIRIAPNQVHRFWNENNGELIVHHRIQPPGKHGDMFRLIHKLETEGKLTKKGIPKNLLWLGLAWECIDGYLVGPPPFLQRKIFGFLASMAKRKGYKVP